MRLSSARALKQELLARPLGTGGIRRSLASEMRAACAPKSVQKGEPEGIAIGIKGTRHNYRLAVRMQGTSPGIGLLMESFRLRAKGEMDLRHVGRVRKQLWYRRRNRPLLIGTSIGPESRSYGGTLGCFVVPTGGDPEDAHILSNNHVLADENRLRRGVHILQPARLDHGRKTGDRMATLARYVRLKKRGVNELDAAIADLRDEISYYYNWLEGLGPITGVRLTPLRDGEKVYKVGRTTGLTEGRVSAFEVDQLEVGYDTGDLIFDGQIEIEPAGNSPFSLSGDSGSLIVDARRRAVALLFAGNDVDVTYANPIDRVLEAFGVDLIF